jgi:ABC-type uncharacterized transport system substrate-binding protein
MPRLRTLLLVFCALLAMQVGKAAAHPHVWVTMKSALVYAPDGAVTGVRHAWTFDDMYSAFAVQDLKANKQEAFTREELAPLAEVNVSSLKDFDYFTFAKANGKKVRFADPVEYSLEYKDSVLTLHFTLPLKSPMRVQDLELEIYDPSYFVDFSFAEKDAFALNAAPQQCQFSLKKPNDAEVTAKVKSLGEAFFAQADSSTYGAMFANKVSVKCP